MLEQKIEVVIDHKKCLGATCLNCVDSCPVEAIDWDKEQKKVVANNFQECIVCLACEEADAFERSSSLLPFRICGPVPARLNLPWRDFPPGNPRHAPISMVFDFQLL
jgi:NAD-dependent dihydropyrimidine dehydrogenase PreA subunit